VLLMNGQPVDGFMGALPEGKIKEFLDKHVPAAGPEDDEEDLAANAAEADADPAARLEKLQHAVAADPSNDDARFEYVKALLLAGRDDDAKVAFAPVIDKRALVRRFDSLQRLMDAIDFAAATPSPADFDSRIATNKRDFEARFSKAQWLMAHQRWTDAMDELLEILMRDKAWSEERARKTYIAILDMIEPPKPKVAEGQIPPDDPVVATYRRRLSSVVLS
jgi:putative thioredoxin